MSDMSMPQHLPGKWTTRYIVIATTIVLILVALQLIVTGSL